MPIRGVECKGSFQTFQACLECKTPCAPYPWRKFIIDNIQDRGQALSPSVLTTPCLLSVFLGATNDYYLPLERLHQPNYGVSMHLTYGSYVPAGDKSEHKVKSEKLGITGTLDHFQTTGDELIDLKTTSNIGTKKEPSKEHQMQVNLYAYMLREEGHNVSKASIFYTDPARYLWLPVPLLSDAQVEDWAMPRIELLNNAFKGKAELEPEPCYLCNGYNKTKKIYCNAYNLCKRR